MGILEVNQGQLSPGLFQWTDQEGGPVEGSYLRVPGALGMRVTQLSGDMRDEDLELGLCSRAEPGMGQRSPLKPWGPF